MTCRDLGWALWVLAAAALIPAAGSTEPVVDRGASEASAVDASAVDPSAGDTAVSRSGPARLEITFLANESFLLSAGGRAVLIDGFVGEPYLQYSAVPDSVLVAMAAGDAPFDEVVLALVSHAHRDHHQEDVARAYFAERPEVLFVTSPQVMEQTFPESGPARPQGEAVLPAPGESVVRELGGVRVEFLGLPHGGSSGAQMENLGHVIEVGGRRVLHVGDADPDPELFASLDLPSRELDVALVPYWYLRTKSGRAFLGESIGATWYIACHIPPAEVAEVTARLALRMPNLRVPHRPMETFRY